MSITLLHMRSAHNGRVADMAVLGDGLVSISADMLRYHAVGGLPRMSIKAPEARCRLSAVITAAQRSLLDRTLNNRPQHGL